MISRTTGDIRTRGWEPLKCENATVPYLMFDYLVKSVKFNQGSFINEAV